MSALRLPWLFRRRPGDVRVLEVRPAERVAPKLAVGMIVLVQPRKTDQPLAAPTPVKITKVTRDRLVCTWLTEDEFAAAQADEAQLRRQRKKRR